VYTTGERLAFAKIVAGWRHVLGRMSECEWPSALYAFGRNDSADWPGGDHPTLWRSGRGISVAEIVCRNSAE
jgi:hypothetical protein